jgi:hypothetical protein
VIAAGLTSTAPTASTTTASGLAVIDQLLRDRAGLLARIRAGRDLAALMRVMIATLAFAAAIVGGALGTYRGGVQIAYAALKLPLVLLGTAALSAPALTAVGVALGRRARLPADLALVMAALAFGALLLVAATPLLLLLRALEVPYHDLILAVVAVFASAGVASLNLVGRGLVADDGPGRAAALLALCTVFALVGGQLAWALRPFLVRPRAADVAFIHDVEGSLADAIITSLASARGVYAEPLPEARP